MNLIEVAAIGLRDDNDRMRLISQNVANIATPGYKRQVLASAPFSQLVSTNAADAAAATAMTTTVGAPATDLSMGKLRSTGNPLDVALDDRQFLVVRTADGEQALSRGGALSIDRDGHLAAPGGAVVQGVGGDIEVPATALEVRVDAAGRVLADGKVVGNVQVVRLAQAASAASLGGGLFQASAADGLRPVESPSLHAGYTEASNVVASQEMVQMMETTRHAEAMVKLLQGADELLGQTIRKLGELS